MSIPEVTVHELEELKKSNADVFILDVRNPDEYALCNLGGHLIPFKDLPDRLQELNPNQQIVVHCHAGGRARRATELLIREGFKNVSNLRGGITAWANEIDPNMPTY